MEKYFAAQEFTGCGSEETYKIVELEVAEQD